MTGLIFEGLKVIDCASFIAAPVAATIMADFGADVVKIEAPGGDPYRRQVPVFEAELDRATGLNAVRMNDVAHDPSEFTLEFEPGHPPSNDEGYVQYSNVQTLVEMMDMREAMRTYEANLNMIENARRMQERALDLLRR